jgi:hypothetical protein
MGKDCVHQQMDEHTEPQLVLFSDSSEEEDKSLDLNMPV